MVHTPLESSSSIGACDSIRRHRKLYVPAAGASEENSAKTNWIQNKMIILEVITIKMIYED
jgi:hypothetical protein